MKINWVTVTKDSADGFSTSSRDLVNALNKVNIECTDRPQEISLIYHHPQAIDRAMGLKKILFTMFESSEPPIQWAPYIDKAQYLLNPTYWGTKTFQERYKRQCDTVPLGFNDNNFYYLKRPERKIFTFLQYDCCKRKGFLETWEAFRQEFTEDEPVQMIFKTSKPNVSFPPMWPNMKGINEVFTPEQLSALLFKADCFVFPSRGEGFGHTPLEAMATGIPAITLNAHGISQYFNPSCMWCVEYDTIDAEYDTINEDDLGYMYKAKIDSLRKAMRYAFENRKETKERGKIASEWARNFTWEKTALKLREIIYYLSS